MMVIVHSIFSLAFALQTLAAQSLTDGQQPIETSLLEPLMRRGWMGPMLPILTKVAVGRVVIGRPIPWCISGVESLNEIARHNAHEWICF